MAICHTHQENTVINSHATPLRFFYNPQSRARMVRWMLDECEAPYESVRLEFGTTMKAPDYLAVNPMGKVPALHGHHRDRCHSGLPGRSIPGSEIGPGDE